MIVLPYSQRSNLPNKPGIYYVGTSDAPILYVGLTCNLKKRHANHHRQKQFKEMQNAVIRYKLLPDHIVHGAKNLNRVLFKLEKQAIEYYGPPLNRTPVPSRSMSLRCGTGLLIRYL